MDAEEVNLLENRLIVLNASHPATPMPIKLRHLQAQLFQVEKCHDSHSDLLLYELIDILLCFCTQYLLSHEVELFENHSKNGPVHRAKRRSLVNFGKEHLLRILKVEEDLSIRAVLPHIKAAQVCNCQMKLLDYGIVRSCCSQWARAFISHLDRGDSVLAKQCPQARVCKQRTHAEGAVSLTRNFGFDLPVPEPVSPKMDNRDLERCEETFKNSACETGREHDSRLNNRTVHH